MTKMIPDGFVRCPRCKAGIGEMCHTPKGREVLPPHKVRMDKAEKKYGWIDIDHVAKAFSKKNLT